MEAVFSLVKRYSDLVYDWPVVSWRSDVGFHGRTHAQEVATLAAGIALAEGHSDPVIISCVLSGLFHDMDPSDPWDSADVCRQFILSHDGEFQMLNNERIEAIEAAIRIHDQGTVEQNPNTPIGIVSGALFDADRCSLMRIYRNSHRRHGPRGFQIKQSLISTMTGRSLAGLANSMRKEPTRRGVGNNVWTSWDEVYGALVERLDMMIHDLHAIHELGSIKL